jgi:general secretion pathway protein H
MTRRLAESRGAFGFTLLELLVVISIMSLLVAVVPPLVSSALPGVELRKTARELAAALAAARSQAVARNRSMAVQLDLESRTYRISEGGRATKLPDDVAVSLYGADTEIPSDFIGGIRFFPDGSSTGGRITIERNGRSYRIEVDWLLGSVAVQN